MDPELREYLDRMFGALGDRMEQMESRIDRVEHRMGALEIRVSDGFQSTAERIRSIEPRFIRLAGDSIDLREQVMSASNRIGILGERLGKLERHFLGNTERINGLANEMRERFRSVNKHLA